MERSRKGEKGESSNIVDQYVPMRTGSCGRCAVGVIYFKTTGMCCKMPDDTDSTVLDAVINSSLRTVRFKYASTLIKNK
eukprot:1287812-Rhodomonas_salina.2